MTADNPASTARTAPGPHPRWLHLLPWLILAGTLGGTALLWSDWRNHQVEDRLMDLRAPARFADGPAAASLGTAQRP